MLCSFACIADAVIVDSSGEWAEAMLSVDNVELPTSVAGIAAFVNSALPKPLPVDPFILDGFMREGRSQRAANAHLTNCGSARALACHVGGVRCKLFLPYIVGGKCRTFPSFSIGEQYIPKVHLMHFVVFGGVSTHAALVSTSMTVGI